MFWQESYQKLKEYVYTSNVFVKERGFNATYEFYRVNNFLSNFINALA